MLDPLVVVWCFTKKKHYCITAEHTKGILKTWWLCLDSLPLQVRCTPLFGVIHQLSKLVKGDFLLQIDVPILFLCWNVCMAPIRLSQFFYKASSYTKFAICPTVLMSKKCGLCVSWATHSYQYRGMCSSGWDQSESGAGSIRHHGSGAKGILHHLGSLTSPAELELLHTSRININGFLMFMAQAVLCFQILYCYILARLDLLVVFDIPWI